MTLILIVLIVLVTLLTVAALVNLIAIGSGAPYVPSPRGTALRINTLANWQGTEQVIDLGSGDGKLCIAIAPHVAQVTGIELNPVLVFVSTLRARLRKQRNVRFHVGDMWEADLGNVDAVVIYCIAGKMKRMQKKLQRELTPGARVFSVGFQFPSWQEEAISGRVRMYRVT